MPGSGVLLAALALAAVAAAGLLAPFRVTSDSMRDTLLPGDFVVVSRGAYGIPLPWGRPGRGDVVVLEAPDHPGERVVKRVVATAGQTVAIVDKRLIVDGDTLVEPWAAHGDPEVHPAAYDARDNVAPLTLEPGQVFVLGDNRDDSEDSRFWGPVRADAVIGRGLVIYWSWDEQRGRLRWERILRPVH